MSVTEPRPAPPVMDIVSSLTIPLTGRAVQMIPAKRCGGFLQTDAQERALTPKAALESANGADPVRPLCGAGCVSPTPADAACVPSGHRSVFDKFIM